MLRTMLIRDRRGAMIVLLAMMVVAMLMFVAFAVDIGFICVVRTDLQSSTDSAALAAAQEIFQGANAVSTTATKYAQDNFKYRNALASSDVGSELGHWNAASRVFMAGVRPFDAVQISGTGRNLSFFFAPVVGKNSFDVTTKSVAAIVPRDFMLILDVSGSMYEQDKIGQLRSAVQAFLQELAVSTDLDRVGIVTYTNQATLRTGLTFDLNHVSSIAQGLNAGGWTNIGDAMRTARTEILNHPRTRAAPVAVLMTDGIPNFPFGNGTTTQADKDHVTGAADLFAAMHVPVLSISFGDDADQSLMQQVADRTKSVHYHARSSDSGNGASLHAIFEQITRYRPVQLVQ